MAANDSSISATQVGSSHLSAAHVGDSFSSLTNETVPLSSAAVSSPQSHTSLFDDFERMGKRPLLRLASEHGLTYPRRITRDQLRDLVMDHVCDGLCATSGVAACVSLTAQHSQVQESGTGELQALILGHRRQANSCLETSRISQAGNGGARQRDPSLLACSRPQQ
jgi:hypothetical protein